MLELVELHNHVTRFLCRKDDVLLEKGATRKNKIWDMT